MTTFAKFYTGTVLGLTLGLALLKVAHTTGVTWLLVALPIAVTLMALGVFGLYVMAQPEELPPISSHKYEPLRLRVRREIPQDESLRVDRLESYYRKALALELATLAHDTPGAIEWKNEGNRITAELKILVRNED